MDSYTFGLTEEERAQLTKCQRARMVLEGTDSLKHPGFPGARKVPPSIRLKLTETLALPEEPTYNVWVCDPTSGDIVKDYTSYYEVLKNEHGKYELIPRGSPCTDAIEGNYAVFAVDPTTDEIIEDFTTWYDVKDGLVLRTEPRVVDVQCLEAKVFLH